MKTLIIGLFGLALLTSSAAWGAPRSPHGPAPGPLAKIGTPAICTLTGGIIVIVLQNTGDVVAFACNNIKGKTITYHTSLPAGYPTFAVDGDLGKIEKHKKPGDPDPCVTWTSFGTSKTFCW